MDIASQLPNWNALMAAWLPGTEGQGVADVLFGVAQPTGKLPMTWMNSASQEPINDGDGQTPLFPYGFGLAYGQTQPPRSALTQIQAESFNAQSGTQNETTTDTGGGQDVGHIAPGDSLAYDLDFSATTPASVTTRLASGASSGTIQYRLDSTTGPIIASVPVTSTGGWQTWISNTTNLSGTATGVHRLYLTFTGTAGTDFVNLNWLQFNAGGSQPNAYNVRQAESFTSQSGVQTETTTDTGGGQNVGFIAPGDWMGYTTVDFGSTSPASVTTRRASGATATGTIQYRLDSTTGPIIASVAVSNTGGWQTWVSTTTTLSGSATGVHTVFMTFTGTGGDFTNVNWFQFNH
jgi:beta-glucosidase